MSKLQDAADALQALERLRQALRSPIGTVVAGVAHEVAHGSTLTDAIGKHINVKIAPPTEGPVTIGDVLTWIWSNGAVPTETEPDDWYYVEGVRYCSRCRTRRCDRQPGGYLRCKEASSQGGAPRPEAEGAGEARSEEKATMFPEQDLQGKKQNSNP